MVAMEIKLPDKQTLRKDAFFKLTLTALGEGPRGEVVVLDVCLYNITSTF